jgi:hypothetical protein
MVVVSVAYGVRMIDRNKTLVHVENIKLRDFVSPRPFKSEAILTRDLILSFKNSSRNPFPNWSRVTVCITG